MNVRLFLSSLQAMIACIFLLLGTVLFFNLSSPQSASTTIDNLAILPSTDQYKNLPDSIPSPARGATLWKANVCSSCHARNMKDDMTAPALAGVTDRWADYAREDLYAWVRQSQKLIGSGHPRANAVWKDWGPSVMPNYTNLTDYQIEDLLAFIEKTGNGTYIAGDR